GGLVLRRGRGEHGLSYRQRSSHRPTHRTARGHPPVPPRREGRRPRWAAAGSLRRVRAARVARARATEPQQHDALVAAQVARFLLEAKLTGGLQGGSREPAPDSAETLLTASSALLPVLTACLVASCGVVTPVQKVPSRLTVANRSPFVVLIPVEGNPGWVTRSALSALHPQLSKFPGIQWLWQPITLNQASAVFQHCAVRLVSCFRTLPGLAICNSLAAMSQSPR